MTTSTYKVVSATGYAGYMQGETFDAELDPDAERRAIERGSIKKTKKTDGKEEAQDG